MVLSKIFDILTPLTQDDSIVEQTIKVSDVGDRRDRHFTKENQQ